MFLSYRTASLPCGRGCPLNLPTLKGKHHRLLQQRAVPRLLHIFIGQRHRFLARWTRIRFHDDKVFLSSICRGREQVGSSPLKIPAQGESPKNLFRLDQSCIEKLLTDRDYAFWRSLQIHYRSLSSLLRGLVPGSA